MSDRWQEGQYEGFVLRGESFRSAVQGTRGFRVTFQVGDHEKDVVFWMSDKAAPNSLRDLATLGFNRDFAEPQFSNKGPHKLTLKYETYKDKLQERWSLRTSIPLSQDDILHLNALARQSEPPPRPSTPIRSGPPKRPGPPTKKEPKPCSESEAWDDACELYKDDKEAEDKFIAAIEAVEKSSSKLRDDFTPAEWGRVRESFALPF